MPPEHPILDQCCQWIQRCLAPEIQRTHDEIIENRRSWVRVATSYFAMSFVFVGSSVFVLLLFVKGHIDKSINVFNILLPIGSGVIGYWFAEQQHKNREKDINQRDENK